MDMILILDMLNQERKMTVNGFFKDQRSIYQFSYFNISADKPSSRLNSITISNYSAIIL